MSQPDFSRAQAGDPVVAVEHVDRTKQPRRGGKRIPGTVAAVSECYIAVDFGDDNTFGRTGRPAGFWRSSGWTAWDGSFCWRLQPAGTGGHQ